MYTYTIPILLSLSLYIHISVYVYVWPILGLRGHEPQPDALNGASYWYSQAFAEFARVEQIGWGCPRHSATFMRAARESMR